MIVHQFLSTFEPGAVGMHTILARDALRAAGHTSDIWALQIHPAYAHTGASLAESFAGPADLLVYQMAIGSSVAEIVRERTEPLVVNHHNLTPWRFLVGWEPAAAHGVALGIAQLHALATRAELGLAVSHYNEADLIEAGYRHTAVVPILVDLARFDAIRPDERVRRDGSTTWLFVGRLARNKAQHDIVKALAAYRRFHDPDARLVLVGGGVDEPYGRALRRFVHALELDDAVTFAGAATAEALAAHYAAADVLVVCSEHEGFCVPLLEAWHFQLPIVAYAAAAVPETLGDAGLLLGVKDPCTVANAVHHVVGDAALRRHLVAAGSARLRTFDPAVVGPRYVDTVTAIVGARS